MHIEQWTHINKYSFIFTSSYAYAWQPPHRTASAQFQKQNNNKINIFLALFFRFCVGLMRDMRASFYSINAFVRILAKRFFNFNLANWWALIFECLMCLWAFSRWKMTGHQLLLLMVGRSVGWFLLEVHCVFDCFQSPFASIAAYIGSSICMFVRWCVDLSEPQPHYQHSIKANARAFG